MKAAETVGATTRGLDAGKKINGRKRHVVVDTLGLVTPASVIQGRRSLADWRQGVEDWKRHGGDAMRTEHQKAFESTK